MIKVRTFSAAGAIALVVAVAGPVSATVHTKQPESLPGAVTAVRAAQHWTCITPLSSARTARRGLAHVNVTGRGKGACVSGAGEFWGYTGTVWGLLQVATQDIEVYPESLSGPLDICPGTTGTNLRGGPGTRYRVAALLTHVTQVATDRFVLTASGRMNLSPSRRSEYDGVGWYRITWHGRQLWVASYRVASVQAGCTGQFGWAAYWSTHRHA
jgi:hypothetical protein